MEVNAVYYDERSGIVREVTEIVPFGFKMADYVKWGYLISEEDLQVKRNQLAVIKIKPLKLPKNTIVSSLGVAKHPLGSVIDVIMREKLKSEKIEDEKTIDRAVFLPVKDGKIEKGDLIGSIKSIFIGVGLITKLKSVKIPKIEDEYETVRFRIKYMKNDEIKSFETEKSTHGYIRSNLAYIEPVISAESAEIKAGELIEIEINQIEIPPFTVTVHMGIMQNADGVLIEVTDGGMPKRIEERRILSKAIFMPINDGEIRKGELLGSISVYFVATTPVETVVTEKRLTKALVTYYEDGVIEKRIKYLPPVAYRRGDNARWDGIVADERMMVEKGKPVLIRIRDLVLPKNTFITPLYIMKHALGTILDVLQPGLPPKIDEEKFITHAVFLPVRDGTIERDDLLGLINVYNAETITLEKLSSKLESWKEFIKMRLM
jgi:hypothetical protein